MEENREDPVSPRDFSQQIGMIQGYNYGWVMCGQWFMDECIVHGWVSREYVCGYVMDECIVDGVS
ncbi:hypothetical protein DY000_02034679 [Brassica cretica]|uniref:Uncharacterized protein n=1 Tax=Brassica cretica TaxID=69181 RepID=A0ABQ7DIB7_BRACR|nr:hypothetical protein DY000_02034679 [Brassica cretica]